MDDTKRDPTLDTAAEPSDHEPEGETDLLELVLAEAGEPARPARVEGVVVGLVMGFDDASRPLVEHPENTTGALLAARSTVALDATHIGREAALMFEGGDPTKPIVMGLMHVASPRADAGEVVIAPAGAEPGTPLVAVRDGEKLELSAEREIVLRCGKASITLTRAGKILIRGEYLSSRSAGVHRIQGGSVEIN